MEHLITGNKKLKGKLERIEEMSMLGFNVPEYFLVHDELTLDHLKREIFPNYTRMSLRTYSKVDEIKEFECPFYPNHAVLETDDQSLISIVDDLVKKYYLIVSPPIDPKDCLYAGNVITPELWSNVIKWEFIKGPGTVRDVKTRGCSFVSNRREVIEIHPDFEIIRKMILGFPKEKQIIEWSIYNKQIGKDLNNIIFWEYRKI